QPAAVKHEGANGWLHVDDSTCGPQNCFALSEKIPCHTHAGRHVVVSGGIRLTDSIAYLHQPGGGVGDIVGEQVVRLLDGMSHVVSQTEIQRYPRQDAIVILKKE